MQQRKFNFLFIPLLNHCTCRHLSGPVIDQVQNFGSFIMSSLSSTRWVNADYISKYTVIFDDKM